MEHKIKIIEQFAEEHLSGKKPWELRENDRNYKVGDTIIFTIVDRYYKPIGKHYKREITYLFEGGMYGLEKGFCIFTIK